MAHNSRSFLLALLLISNIVLAITGQAVAGREIPTNSNNVDKKQPEWFIDPDGSVLIPGIGRVMVPSLGGGSSYSTPYSGSSGGSTGSGSGSYIPGGDDTFFPNPGVEVPIPGSGGNIPAAARP